MYTLLSSWSILYVDFILFILFISSVISYVPSSQSNGFVVTTSIFLVNPYSNPVVIAILDEKYDWIAYVAIALSLVPYSFANLSVSWFSGNANEFAVPIHFE